MKNKTGFYLAITGGTIILGIIASLFAFRKNNFIKRQRLESEPSENDSLDLNEENRVIENNYEPVSSWLL